MELLRFAASEYIRACELIASTQARANATRALDADDLLTLANEAGMLMNVCRSLQLPVSLAQAERITAKLAKYSEPDPPERDAAAKQARLNNLGTDIVNGFRCFSQRFVDELEAQVILVVPQPQGDYFGDKWWPMESFEAFPSSQDDVAEAGGCYALGRNTACAFHLMRALEVPLAALSKHLGIEKHSPTWNAYLSGMPAAIQAKYPEKNAADGAKREYFSGLESQLRAVKVAWRNPTMHEVAKVYTDEMAHDLIGLVRSFFREAMKELREPRESEK